MRCDKCGYINSNDETNCKNCGNPLIKDTNIRRYKNKAKEDYNTGLLNNFPTGKVIVGAIFILLLLLIVVGSTPFNNSNDNTDMINEDVPVDTIEETPEYAENEVQEDTKTSQITIEAEDTIAERPTHISGYLTDTSSNPIMHEDIIIQIDNNKYVAQSDANGKYLFTYNNTTKGRHQVTASFSGNENISKSSNTTSFDVKEKMANIDINIKNPIKKDTKNNITGTLTDENNQPISNATIKIRIDNKEVSTKTTDNGSYNVEYTPTTTDNKEVTVTFEGNDTTDKTSSTSQIEVIEDEEINNTTLNHTDTNNSSIDNQTDTNSTNMNNQTNPNDNKTINTTDNDTKSLKDENRTDNNTTSPTNNSINMTDNDTKIDVKLDYKMNNTTIEGKLEDSDDNPVIDAIIKIVIDDKEVTTKTDSNGEYSIDYTNMTNGTHEMSIIYEGDETYNNINKTTKFIIK